MSSKPKRLAAKVLKCGVERVWMDPTNKKVEQAITRSDIRSFIKDGVIKKIPEKRRLVNIQKKQQRSGSIKGARGARAGKAGKKAEWFKKVRPQRKMIKELREKGQIKGKTYRRIYALVKSGMFRSRAHLMLYLKENKFVSEVK